MSKKKLIFDRFLRLSVLNKFIILCNLSRKYKYKKCNYDYILIDICCWMSCYHKVNDGFVISNNEFVYQKVGCNHCGPMEYNLNSHLTSLLTRS